MKNGFYFFVTGNNGGKREGFSIFLTVMLLSIILSIIFGLSAMIVSQHKLERAFARNFVIYYAAETGIERALYSIFKEQQAISHIYQETLDNGADYTVYIYCCLPGAGCDFAEGDCPVYHNGVQMEKEDCSAKRICVYSTGSYLGFKKSLEVEIDQVDRWTGEGGGGGGTFTCGNNFIDQRDGNTYATTQIGDQCWMAENLAYLPSVSPPDASSTEDPLYYVYGYNGSNVSDAKSTNNYKNYGTLYNWPAAIISCPEGWALPTDGDYKQLEMHLGMSEEGANSTGWREENNEGGNLKKNRICDFDNDPCWLDPNSGATPYSDNEFKAIPGGYTSGGGYFYTLRISGYLWTLSESYDEAWTRFLDYRENGIWRGLSSKHVGISLRCLVD